jgi:hypothetical protein
MPDFDQANDDGFLVSQVEGSLGAWEYGYYTALTGTIEGRKLLGAAKVR